MRKIAIRSWISKVSITALSAFLWAIGLFYCQWQQAQWSTPSPRLLSQLAKGDYSSYLANSFFGQLAVFFPLYFLMAVIAYKLKIMKSVLSGLLIFGLYVIVSSSISAIYLENNYGLSSMTGQLDQAFSIVATVLGFIGLTAAFRFLFKDQRHEIGTSIG